MDKCTHQNFDASVTVNRIENTGQFMAEVYIECHDCKEPFHFVGVDYGVSFQRPMINVLGTELSAPIMPGKIPVPKLGRYKVEM